MQYLKVLFAGKVIAEEKKMEKKIEIEIGV